MKSSVTAYYKDILGKFKDNENYTISKLDQISTLGAAKGKKSMQDAVANNERIRQWEDHKWDNEKLIKEMGTSIEHGMV